MRCHDGLPLYQQTSGGDDVEGASVDEHEAAAAQLRAAKRAKVDDTPSTANPSANSDPSARRAPSYDLPDARYPVSSDATLYMM